jgi:protein-L-isoaspartate(D-aspartate) O-methyltransferase
MRLRAVLLVMLLMATGCSTNGTSEDSIALPISQESDEFAGERLSMVENQIVQRAVTDQVVIDAMRAVPRHRFVPDGLQGSAYNDHALPIGHGQTISQPYIVALMSEALEVEPGERVLEVGTGSGYQAAVLAEMGLEVYSIEIIPELADRARGVISDLGYDVAVRTGDGYFGWEEAAPFDGIIVTAAPDHVPQALVEQLAPGATLVIPVGPIGAVQTLWQFTLQAGGELSAESLGPVMFVPFTRSEA